jgi:hypothetical protein
VRECALLLLAENLELRDSASEQKVSRTGGASMSLIVTIYVREGIVMASDSRLSLNSTSQQDQGQTVLLSASQSDSSYKTFLTPSRVGISTCGAADINGVPIAGTIESFIHDVVEPKQLDVEAVPTELLTYFAAFSPVPKTQFHVAGYKKAKDTSEQHVWSVSVADGKIERSNPNQIQGISWGGEADVLTRIIQPVGQLKPDGSLLAALPHHQIPWPYFTLQDAIDFAVFAIRSTIDVIRFQPRAKTVGGAIDVLVLKPSDTVWVSRKELRVLA